MNALPTLRVKTLSVWNDVLSLSLHDSKKILSSARKGRSSAAWGAEACEALRSRGVAPCDLQAIERALLASDDLPMMERGHL